ncbi:META domain-containing protein [uncultured Enterovirga sp.]|uniref:META domain-containing protein n=1 Tax=uncultured Enterovirga sp. TaxID=2026352 RepID=UPI0035CB4722
MRRLAILSLLGIAAFASVAEAQSRGKRGNEDQQTPGFEPLKKQEEKRFPLGSSWIAISINGKAFSGTERPAFSVDEQFRVQGFGGCNSFSATAFPLRAQGIAVGPLALTKRSCDKGVMATEMSFLTALRTSAKWDTQIGSLVIRGPNGELKFERSL